MGRAEGSGMSSHCVPTGGSPSSSGFPFSTSPSVQTPHSSLQSGELWGLNVLILGSGTG